MNQSYRSPAIIMKVTLGLSLLPLLASASPLGHQSVDVDAAPLISSVDSEVIPDSYMVIFKDHVTKTSAADHHSWLQNIHGQHTELRKRSQWPFVDTTYEGLKHTYHIPGSLLGYSGHFDKAVVDEIRSHPDVPLRHLS